MIPQRSSAVIIKKALRWAALSTFLPCFAGCSDSSRSAPQSDKPITLQDVELKNLKWDQPDDSYRIGLHFVVVKLSRDVDTEKPSIIALSTRCPKDGLSLPVLYLEKILHCPSCGSDFDFRGVRLRGPAPGDLERYKIGQNAKDGKILVALRTTFKRAEGGWKKPESFLRVE